jgi:hypothetical protein
MQTPEEVAAMPRLKGWGVRRIAGELGCSHMTVRRYLAEGGWVAYRGSGRSRTLAGLEDWIATRFPPASTPMWSGSSLSGRRGSG